MYDPRATGRCVASGGLATRGSPNQSGATLKLINEFGISMFQCASVGLYTFVWFGFVTPRVAARRLASVLVSCVSVCVNLGSVPLASRLPPPAPRPRRRTPP